MSVTFKEGDLVSCLEKLFYWSNVIGYLSCYYAKKLRFISFPVPEIFIYSIGIT